LADLSGSADGDHWFAVLPDCAAATAAAQLFASRAHRVVPHPSGRLWLVGRWPEGTLSVWDEGGTRTALLGSFASPKLDGPGRPAGAYHVITASGEQITVTGTASGLRRVFHARVGGVSVAGDRGQLLAEAAGTGPDPAAVAGLLLGPVVPHPLAEDSLWTGVTAVPPDHRLTITGDQSPRTDRWWHPPEPAGTLAEGAAQLYDRLRAAVAVRAAGGGRISADLSGGVDSTALCFLAAAAGADLLTVRVGPVDPGSSDDPAWARLAADRLPGEHLVLDPHAVFADPPPLSGLDGEGEEPVGGLLTRAVLSHTARLLAAHGSRRHLAGYGGDEVTGVSRAYLRDLLPHRRRLVLGHARAHRSLRGWSMAATLRALADRHSYSGWLTGVAAGLRDPRPPGAAPQFGWGGAARLPAWATVEAAELVTGRLARAARETGPLAATRAQHRAVTAVWSAAHAARALARAMPGLSLAVPYLDDPVVEVALAVDLAERGNPYRYKPLLTEAVGPLLPTELRGRRTKGEFTADGMAGLRRHRATLVELCEEPLLGALGLVDPAALRAACVGLDPSGRALVAVENTVAVELWLRAVAGGRFGAG
jgi:asparagine synthase (glutamine-hydrolysing)